MESRRRSVVKAVSWRVVATSITAIVAWVITESLQFAALIGGADTVLKLAAFYYHERLWMRVSYGRLRGPDFEI